MHVKIEVIKSAFFLCVLCIETDGNLFCTMGNIKDKQTGSLYRNFIAHVERDKVLKLVF